MNPLQRREYLKAFLFSFPGVSDVDLNAAYRAEREYQDGRCLSVDSWA